MGWRGTGTWPKQKALGAVKLFGPSYRVKTGRRDRNRANVRCEANQTDNGA